MDFYGAKELADSFRTVRKNTIRVAEDIPADKYGFSAAPGARTVEKMLTHIALSYDWQYGFHGVERRTNFDGLNFPALFAKIAAEEAISRTKAEILTMLRETGEA